MKRSRRPLLIVVLLGSLALLGSTPVQAQLSAAPSAVSVAVPQGEEAERTVTLTNTGSEAVAFCLSFDRPLQRQAGLKLSEEAAGGACGEIGEILFELDEEDAGLFWDPSGMAMTPDGRLFTADYSNLQRTHELTPELALVRSFPQPIVEELDSNPVTRGVTYNPDTGTLWWLNIEQEGFDFRRVLLLEGTLDGVATGRRIELPLPTDGDPPETFPPGGLSYDPATERYYYSSAAADGSSLMWAADTLGTLVPGYPIEQMAYPGGIAIGPDVHGGMATDGASGEPEAVRLELAVIPPGGGGFDRLVVVDPGGNALGIETPLPDVSGGTGFGSITGELLRSRIDPNGVLYFPFVNFDTDGVVGIRPHPLPPSWLALSRWDGTLGPGESTEIALAFSAGTRAVGNTYNAALQVFEAESGAALEVPLMLEVTESTAGEEEPGAPAEASLAVWPNPTAGDATLAVALPERSHLRLAVYDVLGRRVALLADGQTEAGQHRFAFDGQHLPAGIYLVRAEVSGPASATQAFTERITLVK